MTLIFYEKLKNKNKILVSLLRDREGANLHTHLLVVYLLKTINDYGNVCILLYEKNYTT